MKPIKRKFLSSTRTGIFLISFLFMQGCGVQLPGTQTDSRTGANSETTNVAATPEVTPSPTPLPKIRIENAEYKIFIGDYLQAKIEYEKATDPIHRSLEKAIANVGIGRVHYLLKDYPNAIETLEQLIINYPDSFQLQMPITFWLVLSGYPTIRRISRSAVYL